MSTRASAPTREIPPFLAHLRTDRRGLPVPYINLWGPEDLTRTAVRYDPHVGMDAVFLDDEGQTEPDFTRQHMGRQRECMTAGRCQVCARPVPWSRRYLVIADMSSEVIDLGGRPAWVLTEPWLDERCAHFALQHCPALIRRRRDEHLTLLPVTSKNGLALTVSTGWIEGPLEAQTRAHPVAMWAKVAVSEQVLNAAEVDVR